MSHEEPDDLLRALRDLPSPDVDAARAARVGRHARAAFVESATPAPILVRLGVVTGRAVMPVVLASIIGVYLVWALSAATALVR